MTQTEATDTISRDAPNGGRAQRSGAAIRGWERAAFTDTIVMRFAARTAGCEKR